jgi:alkylation response protein AidB-like acyl-CoA dehydrogenase
MTVNNDWDALGMRASGSHSVTFDGAEIPESALRGGFPIGSGLHYMESNLTAGLFHAAASLGIAEAAHGLATAGIARRNGSFKDGRGSTLLGESTIDLAAQRSIVARAALLVDDYYASGADADPALVPLFAEVQAAKTFVNEAATRVVDRALALSGGAGYMNGNPLARHYRDVRAGAFMHPLGANRAYDVLAQVATGREPALH